MKSKKASNAVVVSGKNFQCNRCSRVYKSYGFFRRHQQYHCAASSVEDHNSHSEAPSTVQYFCAFCKWEYSTKKLFDLHRVKCRSKYNVPQTSKQSSSPPSQRRPPSCHRNKVKRTVKNVIAGRNSKKVELAALTGIPLPDISKLPRIPRLSDHNRLLVDTAEPHQAEPLAVDEQAPKQHPDVATDWKLFSKSTPAAANDGEINNEMPMLVIQNVKHMESFAESTDDLEQQLLEDIHVSEEDEKPSPASMVSSQETPSSEDPDLIIVEEQPAVGPNGLNRVQASDGRTPAVVSNQASSRTTTGVRGEDDDLIIVEDAAGAQPGERVSTATTSTVTVLNVKIQTRISLESKPFVCIICTRRFRTENAMRLHRSTHEGISDNFERAKCGTHEEGNPRCCSHGRLSSECGCLVRTRRFECSFCGFSSVDQNAVAKHKIHFHKKNFACKLCDRTFRTRATRSEHRKTHTAEGE